MTAPLPAGFAGIRRILVPVDFSEAAPLLVAYTMELVRGRGATVRLLHVLLPPVVAPGPAGGPGDGDRLPALLREDAEDRLRAVAAEIRGIAVERKICIGLPSMTILREAREWPADVVVIATHGRTGLRRAFLGSVAEEVVRRCPCPVLAVRHSDVEEPARA